MKRALIVMLVPIVALSMFGRVFALSAQDLFSLNNDSIYYDGSEGNNTGGSSLDSGICISMSCITINNKQALIEALAKFIESLSSTSPFDGIAMATAIVDGSIAENVNPFLVVAIGWHESGLGAAYPPGSYNAFGRKAGPGQPFVTVNANGTNQPTNWYKWPSWLASVSDPSTDEQSFIKAEYIDQGINSIPAFVNKYAPPGDGNNTAEYISYLTNEINDMVAAAGNSITINYGSAEAAVALSCTATITAPTVAQKAADIAEQQLACWQKGTIQPPGSPIYTYSGIDEEWCADFVSWVYNQAGHPFKGGNGGWDLPGVYEIYTLGNQAGSGFIYHASGSYKPQLGDLAIHSGGNYSYMGHVNIVVAVGSNGNVTLIGGDQTNPSTGVWTVDTSVVSEVGSEPSTSDDIIGYVSPD